MRLEGKVAVVTGAASGFGEAISKRFAKEGAAVVVADMNEAGAAEVSDTIQAAGGKATAIAACTESTVARRLKGTALPNAATAAPKPVSISSQSSIEPSWFPHTPAIL